jgi:hypothetical protein
MQAAGPTAGQVREALATVLARPEFAEKEPPKLLVWIGELWARFLETLRALISRIDLADGAGTAVAWTLRAALLLGALALSLYLLGALMRWSGRHGQAGRRSADLPSPDPERVDWALEAERAAEAGRFRAAVLALYQEVVERLHLTGAVRRDRAKTPGDYRRELGRHPELMSGFDEFLRVFEPVAFGGHEPDRRAYDRLRALAGAP